MRYRVSGTATLLRLYINVRPTLRRSKRPATSFYLNVYGLHQNARTDLYNQNRNTARPRG